MRVSVDVVVDKGDPSRLVQAMSKKDVRREMANYIAHVAVSNTVESAEVSPLGAFVHWHDHNGSPCSIDRQEASAYLPGFD
jgi:hypothetical protein